MKNNKRSKSAYTLAEVMVVSAMILVAIAYMTSVLRNKLPDADKTTIRHAYGQIAQVVAELAQHEAYNNMYGQHFANTYPYAELVYSNGLTLSAKTNTEKLAALNTQITKVQNTNKEQIKDATLLRNAKVYGGTKFADLFKSMLNIKEDNIETKVNAENTVPICCHSNLCVSAIGSFTDPYDNITKSKMTCLKTNKGITYCLPNNTRDPNCFDTTTNYNKTPARAETDYMIVKIFLDDKYKNEDGYYLKISPTGKISIYPPKELTYGPNNSLSKPANDKVDCYNKDDNPNYDTSIYNTYKQCKLNDYLLYTNPHKN